MKQKNSSIESLNMNMMCLENLNSYRYLLNWNKTQLSQILLYASWDWGGGGSNWTVLCKCILQTNNLQLWLQACRYLKEVILSWSYVHFDIFRETKLSELCLETWTLESVKLKHFSNIQNYLKVHYIRTCLQEIAI